MEKRQTRHTVFVIETVGRLGNQIILFANLIALSMATGITVAHPTLGVYANYFAGTVGDLLCRYPQSSRRRSRPNVVAWVAIRKLCRLLDKSGILAILAPGRTFESDYHSLVDMTNASFIAKVRGGRFTFLTKGWQFQYSHVRKEEFMLQLRSYFRLAEPYASNVESIVAMARVGCDVLIGVHIRQTDFKAHADGRYYFVTNEYERLMRHCERLFRPARVAFLVVSDEKHGPTDFPSLNCFFGSGVDVEDMYCLGNCDYIIGSVGSSFSLWPAVLFQKPTYRITHSEATPSLSEFVVTSKPWIEESST